MPPTKTDLPRRIAETWDRRRDVLLRLAVLLLGSIALLWLSYETFRLFWQPTHIGSREILSGGLDLRINRDLSLRWFSGEPIYTTKNTAVYPPASYPVFWLLGGWLPFAAAKFVWAVTAVVCLVWLVRLTVAESGAESRWERVFVALIPLSMYATGATVGNGQLTIHLMALLAYGLALLQDDRRTAGRAVLGSALLLLSLVKPTVAAPFYWIALFTPGVVWPAALVALGYALLTLFSAAFQEADLVSLLASWLNRGAAASLVAGESNLQIWLSTLGLGAWVLHASLIALAALGLWVWRNRKGDFWLLMGVTAVVARLWAYHRWYDDMLLLFPLLALYRLAKNSQPGSSTSVAAGILFLLTAASTLAPGGLYLLPPPWNTVYMTAQNVIWIVVMLFLARAGHGIGTPAGRGRNTLSLSLPT